MNSKINTSFLHLVEDITNTLEMTEGDLAIEMGKNTGYIAQLKSRIKKIPDFEVPRSVIDRLILIRQSKQEGASFELNDPDVEPYRHQLAIKKNNQTKKNTVPFYDAEAIGGDISQDMNPIHAPAGTIDIGDLLHDSQAAIRIYGNSMLPNYPPGCVVGLLKCTDSFIEPGEVYVIETRDRRMLKRLFYPDDNTNSDHFTCYSDNTMLFDKGPRHGKPAYPPFDLPRQEIIRMYMITGVIKRNANSIVINR